MHPVVSRSRFLPVRSENFARLSIPRRPSQRYAVFGAHISGGPAGRRRAPCKTGRAAGVATRRRPSAAVTASNGRRGPGASTNTRAGQGRLSRHAMSGSGRPPLPFRGARPPSRSSTPRPSWSRRRPAPLVSSPCTRARFESGVVRPEGGPAASGAVHRRAEGRPRTGRTRIMPTTRQGAVPGVAGRTGLSQHAPEGSDSWDGASRRNSPTPTAPPSRRTHGPVHGWSAHQAVMSQGHEARNQGTDSTRPRPAA